MGNLKLGKSPAREGAIRFSLTDYVSAAGLPVAPSVFGHQDLVSAWGMLGNDQYGDCVWAGAGHEHILWGREAGRSVAFTDADALSDYGAVTGFTPSDPNSDQGTDMEVAAKYRRTTGVVDAAGFRHKVDAYVALPGISAKGANDPKFLDVLASATYLFGAVGIGIEFPGSAMDQFNTGKPWDVVSGSAIEGGHYIPLVGRKANGNFLVVTWGAIQEVTPRFLLKYVDEAIVYLDIEALTNNASLEGFDVAALQADLTALGNGSQPAPAPAPTPIPTPTPPPIPAGNPFPVELVKDWLNARHYGAAKRAQVAIQGWLKNGGK